MSKSVSWKVSRGSKNRLTRSAPARRKSIHGLTCREQPTWINCKKDCPVSARPPTRSHSPRAQSSYSFSIKSNYSLCFVSEDNAELVDTERGREVLRKKAKSQLRFSFPSKFVKFEPSDLKAKALPRKQSGKKFSASANAKVEGEKTRNRVYFINGVPSRSYRRPSIQFGDVGEPSSQSRRFSDPLPPSFIGQKAHSVISKFSGRASSTAGSLSAPATIASNDELPAPRDVNEEPKYLKRDWKSDILSRYCKTQPWTPKYRTNRYFPKFNNFQDLHCKNPYLIPNGILCNSGEDR